MSGFDIIQGGNSGGNSGKGSGILRPLTPEDKLLDGLALEGLRFGRGSKSLGTIEARRDFALLRERLVEILPDAYVRAKKKEACVQAKEVVFAFYQRTDWL